ncbi:hypothetical protein ABPG75_006806 [Micractinium tetrahymenae]
MGQLLGVLRGAQCDESGPDATGALPDELLAAILGQAGPDAGRSTTLVCRRWHRLFWGSPSGLWGEVTLDGSRLAELGRDGAKHWLDRAHWLLGRVAPQARTLTLRGGRAVQSAAARLAADDRQVAQLLGMLRADTLCTLCIDYCPPDAQLAVQGFAGLTSLHMACAALPPEPAAALLQQLRQLRSLRVPVAACTAPLSDSLGQLSVLAELSLECQGSLMLGPELHLPGLATLSLTAANAQLAEGALACLAHSPQLSSLQLCCQGSLLGTLQALPALDQLQHLAVELWDREWRRCLLHAVQQQLARFPALTSFQHSEQVPTNGGCQVGPAVLHAFAFSISQIEGELQPEGQQQQRRTSLQLRLTGLHSLQALLEALLPAGARLARRRPHHSWGLPAAALEAGPALAALEALDLEHCKFSPGIVAALEVLLGGTPCLTELSVGAPSPFPGLNPLKRLGCMPASLAQLRGLRRLALRGQGLSGLPPGSVWAGLEALDLGHNRLPRLPAELASATSLTSLLLDHNSQLQLSGHEADAILAQHLPRLCLLGLQGTAGVARGALKRIRTSLPDLEVVM